MLVCAPLLAGVATPQSHKVSGNLAHGPTSLGDVHTMMLYPVMSSHREISPKHRERMGIRGNLVRLSVGIEAVDDIVGDLQQALEALNQ